jgi:CheY-like chemotaxis protein
MTDAPSLECRTAQCLCGKDFVHPEPRKDDDTIEKPNMQYKVMIVDDSKLARMVMASTLRRIRADWELIEATDTTSALEAISTRAIDIALVDFNMPGKDGLELVGLIRKAHPKMPVALVSANVQTEIISRARELNAGFIAKPVTDEALASFLSGAALRLKNGVK